MGLVGPMKDTVRQSHLVSLKLLLHAELVMTPTLCGKNEPTFALGLGMR